MNSDFRAPQVYRPHIPKPSIEAIYALERELLKRPQSKCPIRNIFAPGIYAREMTIPAGTVLTGAVHKTEHINIVSKGRITVYTDEGMRELAAPHIMVSQPGTKRVGYAHEETVWTTIHRTDTTDLRELVEELTTSRYAELLENRCGIESEDVCLLD